MTRYVVMGVSGCGKSHIGAEFARRIGGAFVDGDDLHPASNVAKMARGEPLDDDDRRPWLAAVSKVLKDHQEPVVVACSALRLVYRDWIRDGSGGAVTFLHLAGSREVIAKRMGERIDHFMPLSLLDSQFAALEIPASDEDAVSVDIDQTPDEIVTELLSKLDRSRT